MAKEPVAANRYKPATDPHTGERIYLRMTDEELASAARKSDLDKAIDAFEIEVARDMRAHHTDGVETEKARQRIRDLFKAQRERCAKVCDDWAKVHGVCVGGEAERRTAAELAAAIRKLGDE